ncbi:MAG: NAD(P)-dependent oxidoreductase [Planctomycetaceae bacterium]|jgi:3-hydroxyisobutyrate dehydrogenase-like beta-hydroxyacid dehydrogenase|nr:NAD(P)-dependent oxidoreductase [Planctomycetaceae bacterium]MCE2811902.1 NAD(P)-dependent oxidoreductase [Planctomycetaceae bacterium]
MSNEPSLTPPKNRIGIVGLGLMGTAITQRLLEAGYEVLVWNRSKDKALPLTAAGAKWSECPLVECQRVIISLYSSDVVEEVLASWEKNLSKSQIIIDTTTGDPQAAVRFASALAKRECIYIEAPISGSSQQTRQGLATVIAAGDRTAFDACNDLWPLLGKNTFYVGASGNAAKMKLVSNLVLGLNRAALAEGLAFAETLDIDLQSALAVLQGSGAYSKQMDSKGPKMVSGDYCLQARLSQHLKDVRLILQSAEASNLSLPLSKAHEHLLELAEFLGLGDLDNSAVFEAIRSRSPR